MRVNPWHTYYPWYWKERIDNRNGYVLYFYGVGESPNVYSLEECYVKN